MLGYAARRRLLDYLQATDNEIALDEIALELAGVHARQTGYFPRASKWIKYASVHATRLRLLWAIAAPLWRCGGAALFHLTELVRFGRYASRCRRLDPAPDLNSATGYTLALSSRVGDIIRPPAIQNIPRRWLTLPWAPIRTPPPQCSATDMFCLLGWRDLRRCWWYAVLATAALARRRASRSWVLQSYTAFRWFAVRAALERVSGDLLMAEHYDRWASLVDALVWARQRQNRATAPRLTLVQHGEIGGLSPTEWRRNFYARLRRKLRTVSALYAYDCASEQIFRADLMTSRCSRDVRVDYYRPQIELRRAPSSGIRLLFVGHPLCEDLHMHVLENLRLLQPAQIFYKPHPEARMGPAVAGHDWLIVQDRNVFPEVDLLISYPSTLVTEYAALGIPAVVHPLHLTVAVADDFVSEVRARIGVLARAGHGAATGVN